MKTKIENAGKGAVKGAAVTLAGQVALASMGVAIPVAPIVGLGAAVGATREVVPGGPATPAK